MLIETFHPMTKLRGGLIFYAVISIVLVAAGRALGATRRRYCDPNFSLWCVNNSKEITPNTEPIQP